MTKLTRREMESLYDTKLGPPSMVDAAYRPYEEPLDFEMAKNLGVAVKINRDLGYAEVSIRIKFKDHMIQQHYHLPLEHIAAMGDTIVLDPVTLPRDVRVVHAKKGEF